MELITTIEIKDEKGNAILDAISKRNGYNGFTKNEDGEQTEIVQTKQEFLQQLVLDYVLREYSLAASEQAQAEAFEAKAMATEKAIQSAKDCLKK